MKKILSGLVLSITSIAFASSVLANEHTDAKHLTKPTAAEHQNHSKAPKDAKGQKPQPPKDAKGKKPQPLKDAKKSKDEHGKEHSMPPKN